MVYLQTTYKLCFGEAYFLYFETCDYSRENTNIETYRCIHLYVWFKDDKHVIWMSIWLTLKNISLLDRIWSLWLVRFAHSTTIFIFWLGMLIFSVSINSHPDNIYLSLLCGIFLWSCYLINFHITLLEWDGKLSLIAKRCQGRTWYYRCFLIWRYNDVTLPNPL
jgi:hypothetical protein